jgi:hypothetical protein
MLSPDEAFQLAQEYALQKYPYGYRARVEAEISDPPGFYFGPEYVGDSCDDPILIGEGGFFVSRATGEVRHFGSGQYVLASAAV